MTILKWTIVENLGKLIPFECYSLDYYDSFELNTSDNLWSHDNFDCVRIPVRVYYHRESNIAIIVVPMYEYKRGKVVVSDNPINKQGTEYYFYIPKINDDGLPENPASHDFSSYLNWKSLRSKTIVNCPEKLLEVAKKHIEASDCLRSFIGECGDLSDFT